MRTHYDILIKDQVPIGEKIPGLSKCIPISERNNARPTGRVMAKIHGTDIPLFEEWQYNKVILPGSAYTASKWFKNLVIPTKTPTYNSVLGLDKVATVTPEEEINSNYVFLFAVGTDGCGPEASQKYDVDYTKWIAPESLIPFRYQIYDNDISKSMRTKYFGRKEMLANDRIAYYFKAFDAEPSELKQLYVDGTPIDQNIYTSDNPMDAETYVELKMSITNRDCRDYFVATTGINDAKVNSISLLSAVPKTIDGYIYYQNIRPVTKLNFNNIPLIDETVGVDITYQIFF